MEARGLDRAEITALVSVGRVRSKTVTDTGEQETNEILNIDPAERYSFIFRDSFNPEGSRGDAQILDQAMTSKKLTKSVTGLEFARGNADAAAVLVEDDGTLDELSLRASDHDGLVLYFCKDNDDCLEDDNIESE